MTVVKIKYYSQLPIWWSVVEVWDDVCREGGEDEVARSGDAAHRQNDTEQNVQPLLTVLVDCGWTDKFNKLDIQSIVDCLSDQVDVILLTRPTIYHLGCLPYFVRHAANPQSIVICCTEPVYKLGRATLYEALEAACAENPKFDLFDSEDINFAFENCQRLRYFETKQLVCNAKASNYSTTAAPQDATADGDIQPQGVTDVSLAAHTAATTQCCLLPQDFIVVQAIPSGSSLGAAAWRFCVGGKEIVFATEYNAAGTPVVEPTCLTKLSRTPSLFISDVRGCDDGSGMNRIGSTQALISAAASCVSSANKSGSVLIPIDIAGLLFDILAAFDTLWVSGLRHFPIVLLSPVAEASVLFAKTSLEYMRREHRFTFSSTRQNAFHNLHWLKLLNSLEEYRALPEGPKVVLVTPASLDVGFSKGLLEEWSHRPENLILFPSVPCKGTFAHSLWSERLITENDEDGDLGQCLDRSRDSKNEVPVKHKKLRVNVCVRERLENAELHQLYVEDIKRSAEKSYERAKDVNDVEDVYMTDAANSRDELAIVESSLFDACSFLTLEGGGASDGDVASHEQADEYGEDYDLPSATADDGDVLFKAIDDDLYDVQSNKPTKSDDAGATRRRKRQLNATRKDDSSCLPNPAGKGPPPSSSNILRRKIWETRPTKRSQESGSANDESKWLRLLREKYGDSVLYRVVDKEVELDVKCAVKVLRGLDVWSDLFGIRAVISQMKPTHVMLLPTCEPQTLQLLKSHLEHTACNPSVIQIVPSPPPVLPNSSLVEPIAQHNEKQKSLNKGCTYTFNSDAVSLRLDQSTWKTLSADSELQGYCDAPSVTRLVCRVSPQSDEPQQSIIKRRRCGFWSTSQPPSFDISLPSDSDLSNSSFVAGDGDESLSITRKYMNDKLPLCPPSNRLIGSPTLREVFRGFKESIPEHLVAFDPRVAALTVANRAAVRQGFDSKKKNFWLVEGSLSPTYFLARMSLIKNFSAV